jgi:NADH-quinone oxidoreductase subunit L
MAGPTPVSALIHAATMVTAGVYLMARLHTLFEVSDAAAWATGIGVATAIIAALAAITQLDIKRVLAYSTISQLGFMVASVGMGGFVAGMFHLLTHGLFKALLFLVAGAIIHGTHETQDMRRMGGLRATMPVTFRLWAIGALALAGIFPLAGFWSKDEILGHAWFEAQNTGAAIALIFASALTAFYMGRASALIFAGKQRDTSYTPHEPRPIMRWPMIVLAVGACIGGLLNIPGVHWLSTWLEPVLNEREVVYDNARIVGQVVLAVIVTAIAAGMGYLGWWLYARKLNQAVMIGKEDPAHYYSGDLWQGAEIGWGFDYVYTNYIARPFAGAARFLAQVVDRGAIDGVLVGGTAKLLSGISRGLRAAQTGYVRNYALIFLAGVILLVLSIAMRGV